MTSRFVMMFVLSAVGSATALTCPSTGLAAAGTCYTGVTITNVPAGSTAPTVPAVAANAAPAGNVCLIFSFPCTAALVSTSACGLAGATYTSSTTAQLSACSTLASNLPAGASAFACNTNNCNTVAALPAVSGATSLATKAVVLAVLSVAAATIF